MGTIGCWPSGLQWPLLPRPPAADCVFPLSNSRTTIRWYLQVFWKRNWSLRKAQRFERVICLASVSEHVDKEVCLWTAAQRDKDPQDLLAQETRKSAWFLKASDRFVWMTFRERCASRSGSTRNFLNQTALRSCLATSHLPSRGSSPFGACSPSWRLAKSPVGYEPWRCHDCHGASLFRTL